MAFAASGAGSVRLAVAEHRHGRMPSLFESFVTLSGVGSKVVNPVSSSSLRRTVLASACVVFFTGLLSMPTPADASDEAERAGGMSRPLPSSDAPLVPASQALSKVNLGALDSTLDFSRFIVHYEEHARQARDPQALAEDLARISADLRSELRLVRELAAGGFLLELVQPASGARGFGPVELQAAMLRYAREASVSYVEPDAMMRIAFTPNDTRYNEQWHYWDTTGGIRAPQAWALSRGAGVRVAVLDTGIVPHSDLDANVVGGYDFISNPTTARDGDGRDPNPRDEGDWFSAGECGVNWSQSSSWHGTHVAGTIAAVTNNNRGVAGVAPEAKVVPVRVLGRCGGTLSDIADAIVWASGGSVSGVPNNPHPARVINMSLGGGGACGTTYQNAINSAVNRGSVIIVAAGNENQNASNSRPANCNNVVAVASTNRQGGRAPYSNFGNVVALAAPGGDMRAAAGGNAGGVLSTFNTGTTVPGGESYSFSQGTSMAAPHVAGVAALMLAVNSNLTPAQIRSTLINTARPFPQACSGCGAGIVDAAAAVQAVLPAPPPPSALALQNGQPVTNLSGAQNSERRFTVTVPAGASNLVIAMSGGSGDADLYVRFGSEPTTSAFDCRPYLNGNNETCTFAAPQAGTYHVMVRGFSAYSGVSLQATWSTAPSNALQNNVPVTNLSGAAGSERRYVVQVPSGARNLRIEISGGSGDADLYVRFGVQPTTSAFDCRPFRSGNNEVCTFTTPQVGTYHVMIRGYSSYSGVTLRASWTN